MTWTPPPGGGDDVVIVMGGPTFKTEESLARILMTMMMMRMMARITTSMIPELRGHFVIAQLRPNINPAKQQQQDNNQFQIKFGYNFQECYAKTT